jgi:phage antirepressor YoqD-like protein
LSSRDTSHLKNTKRLLMVTVPTLKLALRKRSEGEAARGLAWAEGLAAGLVPLVTATAPAPEAHPEPVAEVVQPVEEPAPGLCSPNPGSETGLAQLAYNGITIRDRDGKLNLTDMWKAGGADPSKRPAEWLRQEATVNFTDFLASTLTVGDAHSLTETKEGRGGGTWAHWQLGLAYAKYLSPPFHAWGNQVIRDRMEGKIGRPEELATPAIDLNDPRALRATLLGYTERNIALEEEVAAKALTIAAQEPDVAAIALLRGTEGSLNPSDAAKVLKEGPDAFIARLEAADWLFRRARTKGEEKRGHAGKLVADQTWIDSGHMEHRVTRQVMPDGRVVIRSQPMLTAKGIAWWARKLGVEVEE